MTNAPLEGNEHEDLIEQLTAPFYIRWTRGPNYEVAYLCVNDDDADMRDFADVTFAQAALFKAALSSFAQPKEGEGIPAGMVSYDERVEYEERILAVEMENEQLRRALRPFAAKCILWNGKDRNWRSDSTQVQHRLGDFREAFRLIHGEPM